MNLTRISRKTVFLSYAATAPDGSTTDVDELDLSFLPPYTAPDGATQWHQVTGTNGQIPVLLAGPDADPAGAIAVPETGADAWMKAIEGTEVDATKIARITITGGFADYFDFTTIYGPVPAAGADRAQYFLDAASARLSLKLPGLSDRVVDDPNVALIARDIIVQAAIRQFDPARAATQFSQSAGPFSQTINTGARVNRGWFYDDELSLLEGALTGASGLRAGTIKLGAASWTF